MEEAADQRNEKKSFFRLIVLFPPSLYYNNYTGFQSNKELTLN